MIKHGKKYRKAHETVVKGKVYSSAEAFDRVKEAAYVSFDETVDVDLNMGIDPTKGDQVVRGSVLLPHGTGKKVRVIVFAKGEHADVAQEVGADHVGSADLVEKISQGWTDFDYAVATPDMMGAVGKLAKILGPRGLLPNKKVGTVTFDVASIVKDLKKGRAFFKNDKGGAIHFSIGKVSFDKEQLKDNLQAFMKALLAAKPPAAKGRFVRKMTVSSTMGPGVAVSADEFIRT